MRNKKLLVFIPALDEEKTIKDVINLIPKKIIGVKIDTLVVDDGSTDHTVQIAKKQGAKVISHGINSGVGKALQTAVDYAINEKYDYFVNIDADGQFSPKDIPLLLRPLRENNVDCAVADRFTKKNKIVRPLNMSHTKFFGNKIMTSFVNYLIQKNYSDVSSGFRAYSRKALLSLNLIGTFTYTQETFIDLAAKGFTIVNIPVHVKYFRERKSKVANNIVIYTFRSIKIILKTFRDYRPMLFFFFLSMPFFISGFIAGLLLTMYYISTGSLSPYKIFGFLSVFLLSITLFLWGIGILADMFTRVRLTLDKLLYYEKKRIK